MKQFLINWTAETLEGPQWGEFEHTDTSRVKAQKWAWMHLDIVTGLNLRRVLSLSINVRPMAAEDAEPCKDCGHPITVEPLDEPLCDGCEQARAEGR